MARPKGIPAHNKGIPLSERTKKLLSLALKGRYIGENNPSWKGGITPENKKLRNSKEYEIWRKAVFERDGYECVWCGFKGYLEADHIKSFSQFPELRFAIDNGRTLCKICHSKTDNYKGRAVNYKSNI